MPADAYLSIQRLYKTYDAGKHALPAMADVSFDVQRGQFLSILGPSGCGKSTLFNIIAGLLSPTSGDVLLNGSSIVGQPGCVGYMLQRDLLLPWRTIEDNVLLSRTLRGEHKKRHLSAVRHYMHQCGLTDMAQKHPDQLSGGMRQRAALIRTLMTEKDVLLLDEPFGALDALTRTRLQWMLLELWTATQKTILFVTHDIEEAILLSDEVLVLSDRPGRVVERLSIPFPRPRRPELIFDNDFVALRRHLAELLNPEVLPHADE